MPLEQIQIGNHISADHCQIPGTDFYELLVEITHCIAYRPVRYVVSVLVAAAGVFVNGLYHVVPVLEACIPVAVHVPLVLIAVPVVKIFKTVLVVCGLFEVKSVFAGNKVVILVYALVYARTKLVNLVYIGVIYDRYRRKLPDKY